MKCCDPVRRDLIDALWHEHSHAAVARYFGARGVRVTVYRHRHRRPGQVYWCGYYSFEGIRSARGLRCTALAGPLAEVLLAVPSISTLGATWALHDAIATFSPGDRRQADRFGEADVRETLRLLRRYRRRLRAAVRHDEARLLPRRKTRVSPGK